ncbi:MAG: sulfurtransferase TusA family protein [Sulfolobales archaeon]
MVKFVKTNERKYVLDVRGYTCPYPVIYTRKALARLNKGEVLEVLTDNPPSCENVPRAVKDDGHEVLSVENIERGVWRITIVRR